MKNKNGFTLVELLVVIAIIGILATIGLVAFTSAQARSRDATRKSNLKEVSSSLELYYSDYGRYPADVGGKIGGCPSTTAKACEWGKGDSTSEFTDGKTVYFKNLPKDITTGDNYFYKTVAVNSIDYSGYQLFAFLENSQDPSIIETSYSCGPHNCNFSVTSSNTNPTE